MVTSNITEHLEKLRYFVGIAEMGSFARAASTLRVAQPTLSHSIRILEDVLGVKLFVRSSKGITLTSAGDRLYHFGRKLLSDAIQLEKTLHLDDAPEMKQLIIGTKEPYAITLWPRYLDYLECAFPNLDLTLRIGRSNDELVQLLKEDRLDLIIIPNPPHTENMASYELFKDGFHFYVSVSKASKLTPKQLLKLPVYFFQRAMCGKRKTIGSVLKHEKALLENGRDVDSFNVARTLALKGLGIALLPDSLVFDDMESGRLQRIEMPNIRGESFGTLSLCLCLLEKHTRNKAIRTIRHILKTRTWWN